MQRSRFGRFGRLSRFGRKKVANDQKIGLDYKKMTNNM